MVNKTNIIDSTYRNFKMEMLAGEESMVAKVSEVIQYLLYRRTKRATLMLHS